LSKNWDDLLKEAGVVANLWKVLDSRHLETLKVLCQGIAPTVVLWSALLKSIPDEMWYKLPLIMESFKQLFYQKFSGKAQVYKRSINEEVYKIQRCPLKIKWNLGLTNLSS